MKLFLIIFGAVTVLFILLGVAAACYVSGLESRKEEKRS